MGISPTTVAILGGDAMVDRALVILLQGVGDETRAIEDPAAGDPGELLEGIQLLLVTSAPDAETWGPFLAGVRGTTEVPILTLSTALGGTLGEEEEEGLVPWPCLVQDLKRHIEAALLRVLAFERP